MTAMWFAIAALFMVKLHPKFAQLFCSSRPLEVVSKFYDSALPLFDRLALAMSPKIIVSSPGLTFVVQVLHSLVCNPQADADYRYPHPAVLPKCGPVAGRVCNQMRKNDCPLPVLHQCLRVTLCRRDVRWLSCQTGRDFATTFAMGHLRLSSVRAKNWSPTWISFLLLINFVKENRFIQSSRSGRFRSLLVQELTASS